MAEAYPDWVRQALTDLRDKFPQAEIWAEDADGWSIIVSLRRSDFPNAGGAMGYDPSTGKYFAWASLTGTPKNDEEYFDDPWGALDYLVRALHRLKKKDRITEIAELVRQHGYLTISSIAWTYGIALHTAHNYASLVAKRFPDIIKCRDYLIHLPSLKREG